MQVLANARRGYRSKGFNGEGKMAPDAWIARFTLASAILQFFVDDLLARHPGM
jgi:hypothetical protein